MTKIQLYGGDSQNRSSLSSAQRRLNMYSEAVDQKLQEPTILTWLPRPGRILLGTTPNGLPIRCLYKASNGKLFCVAGFVVYYIDESWVFHQIMNSDGTPALMNKTTAINPCKMADNGKTVILCDGTPTNGYGISMSNPTTNGLAPLYDPSASDNVTSSSTGWLGSTYVDYSDTFLIANFIGTPTFYISNSEDVIFDPLQFAGKTAYPDPLVAAQVVHRVVWLIGQLSTEIWWDVGGVTVANGESFPFAIFPGVAIDWGCSAPYSICKAETNIFFLAQNLNGENVVLQGSGYQIKRVSNHALEYQFSTYATTSDCIAYTYMQNGHSFYVMNFPSADRTWVYDLSENEWHERAYTDNNGVDHMEISTMGACAYSVNVVNDWRNGNLYSLDLNTFTDNDQFIKRIVTFPRQQDTEDYHRTMNISIILEMDFGESLIPGDNPMITMRFSDDKGRTWSQGLEQPLGMMGQFNTFVKWNRVGIFRSRVYQFEWTANAMTAIQAAYLASEKTGS